jgi:hypothetical protein
LGVLRFDVLGFDVLGFDVLGFEVLGFEVLGFEVLGFEVLGFEVLELSVTVVLLLTEDYRKHDIDGDDCHTVFNNLAFISTHLNIHAATCG